MSHSTLLRRTVTIQVSRNEKIEGQAWGYRSVPDGALVGQVTLEIDLERLFKQLAPAALRSKGRKAQMASGAVRVVARDVTKTVQS